MKYTLSDFDYNLPSNLIAEKPPEQRGTTRLLVLNKETGETEHKNYSHIPEYIKPNDVVVLNNTKVIKARLHGIIERNEREVECLFLKSRPEYHGWEVLIGLSKHVKVGDNISIGSGSVEVIHREEGGSTFIVRTKELDEESLFEDFGEIPLPSYIKRKPNMEDEVRYNTVFANQKGSVAAPTASLNLTNEILESIKSKGASIVEVNLEIGWGTFAPVWYEDILQHEMHSERYSISDEVVLQINNSITNGGRVWCFGTTSSRVIETVSLHDKSVKSGSGDTNLYIYPGYQFKALDVLVTNFHAPRSSLMMLVTAFGGYQNVMSAYEEAIKEGYSFLSYGDSMLII
jgi:S-adenosylmethionine:tRNA ribosyltransferase-isomerase